MRFSSSRQKIYLKENIGLVANIRLTPYISKLNVTEMSKLEVLNKCPQYLLKPNCLSLLGRIRSLSSVCCRYLTRSNIYISNENIRYSLYIRRLSTSADIGCLTGLITPSGVCSMCNRVTRY
jgi:hypothetical protein